MRQPAMDFMKSPRSLLFAVASAGLIVLGIFSFRDIVFSAPKVVPVDASPARGGGAVSFSRESQTQTANDLIPREAAVANTTSEGKSKGTSNGTRAAVNARVQSDPDFSKSFATSAVSNDPSETTAALAVHFFCSLNSRTEGITFEQWYANLPPLGLLGVPAKALPKVEAERRRFASDFDNRCSGFRNGEMSEAAQANLRSQANKSPIASEISRTAAFLQKQPASALSADNPLFGSGDPAAYKLLTRAALQEVGVASTSNLRVDSAIQQYVLASVVCSLGEDCRPSGLMFAGNCLNLGVCNGTSVQDALEDMLNAHGVKVPNLSALSQAITQWLAGTATWANVVALLPPPKK